MDNLDWETECPNQEDKKHCECWYDGHPCCSCGDPGCPHDWRMVEGELICNLCSMDHDTFEGHVPSNKGIKNE